MSGFANVETLEGLERERDEWKARAENAEALFTAKQAELEKVIQHNGYLATDQADRTLRIHALEKALRALLKCVEDRPSVLFDAEDIAVFDRAKKALGKGK